MQNNALYETSGGTRLIDVEFLLAALDVEPDQHVADFGAGGGGHFTFPLARRVGRGGMVYAVDVVPDNLKGIKRRAVAEGVSHVRVVHSNLEVIGATAITEESLGRVLVVNVLYQNVHHDHILKEAHRLLKPGGKLLVVDWRSDTGRVGPPVARRVSAEQLKDIAVSVGFELEREVAASLWHYGLIFLKK